MNSYSTSTGERLKQSVIDRLITKAKAAKLQQQHDEYGFNFCEEVLKDGHVCGRSGGVPLDCSHEVSVKEAKESGRTELCFAVSNIKIRCRPCHQVKDKLSIF